VAWAPQPRREDFVNGADPERPSAHYPDADEHAPPSSLDP